ncbi:MULTISPECIES: PP0621 family protein [unclassified Caballeronia]|uniref:PP0621 family protein n=1 Tax=unclassified Caballeronia TaxID=2646786 RepID=UPI0028576203|nr:MULTISPECIES: PP0621 family protein [unclassified Caballeronia]MDR5737492.1 PP0621 family protein [Caballeronia sp. LZ016]MDR5809980.1 PP0621 family protein [Caballeronia sp. LZ019]
MRNFILLIVLFFVTQWLLKKLRRANERAQSGATGSAGSTNSTRGRNGAAATDAPQLADPLIRCAQCGVHTPRSESIVVAGERFCSNDHARRHAARPTGRDAR